MLKLNGNIVSRRYFPSSRNYLKTAVNVTFSEICNTNISLLLSNNELKLVIDESISNAMEHGNSWNENKKVEVVIERCNKGLQLTVKDEGEGFSGSKFSHIEDSLSTRGRGLRLLKYYCDSKWNEKGNEVTIVLPFSNYLK